MGIADMLMRVVIDLTKNAECNKQYLTAIFRAAKSFKSGG